MFADAGWQVLFLGTGAAGAGALRFRPHPNIQVRQIPVCSAGWRQKLHYLRFCLWVVAVTLRWRPKWVYASDPFACPVCLLLSRIPKVRIAYHEHDSPQESSVSQFMRGVLWCRRVLARSAALCILPNQQRAESFMTETGAADVLCVWNCPRRDEVVSEYAHTTASRHGITVLYHGSVVPLRLPTALLDALSMLPETVILRVIGYETVGHLGYIQKLKERAKQLGISHRIEFLGSMARTQVLECCRQADVGLALMPTRREDANLKNMLGASNKAFDCLACGIPLLVSDLPEWRGTYVNGGYAEPCVPEDPESIAEALRWFLEHPTEMRQMGNAGRDRVALEWNYETQFAPVMERMSGSIG
jgi:glycosyltransferase involved in cell wall biosynthesis